MEKAQRPAPALYLDVPLVGLTERQLHERGGNPVEESAGIAPRCDHPGRAGGGDVLHFVRDDETLMFLPRLCHHALGEWEIAPGDFSCARGRAGAHFSEAEAAA